MQKQYFNEQGQSLVEIALLLPIILILFLGIAEVGFLLFSHVQVANAARSGARDATLCKLQINGNDCTSTGLTAIVESGVYAEATSLNMNAGNTTVTYVAPSVQAGQPITVTVIYMHTSPIISNFVPMFPAQIPVKHTVVMNFSN